MQIEAPALLVGLQQRADDIAALNSCSSGWQTVTSNNRSGKAAAAGGVLQHWLRGDPVSDWHFKQQLLQAQEEEAEKQRMQEEGLYEDQGYYSAWTAFHTTGILNVLLETAATRSDTALPYLQRSAPSCCIHACLTVCIISEMTTVVTGSPNLITGSPNLIKPSSPNTRVPMVSHAPRTFLLVTQVLVAGCPPCFHHHQKCS